MLGVLMAGGKATRLNHKLLLSTKSGEPVVVGACRYLMEHCNSVVVSWNHPSVPFVIRRAFGDRVLLREDTRQDGIAPAIVSAGRHHDVLVAMGDNVYPKEKLPNAESYVAVREVDPGLKKHLSTYDYLEEKYAQRGEQDRGYAVTTPWALSSPQVAALDKHRGSMESFFNEHRVPSHTLGRGWHDLGTEESFDQYWRQP